MLFRADVIMAHTGSHIQYMVNEVLPTCAVLIVYTIIAGALSFLAFIWHTLA